MSINVRSILFANLLLAASVALPALAQEGGCLAGDIDAKCFLKPTGAQATVNGASLGVSTATYMVRAAWVGGIANDSTTGFFFGNRPSNWTQPTAPEIAGAVQIGAKGNRGTAAFGAPSALSWVSLGAFTAGQELLFGLQPEIRVNGDRRTPEDWYWSGLEWGDNGSVRNPWRSNNQFPTYQTPQYVDGAFTFAKLFTNGSAPFGDFTSPGTALTPLGTRETQAIFDWTSITASLQTAHGAQWQLGGLLGFEDVRVSDGDFNDYVMAIAISQVVPEPSTLALLIAALGALGLAARRRQRKANAEV